MFPLAAEGHIVVMCLCQSRSPFRSEGHSCVQVELALIVGQIGNLQPRTEWWVGQDGKGPCLADPE